MIILHESDEMVALSITHVQLFENKISERNSFSVAHSRSLSYALIILLSSPMSKGIQRWRGLKSRPRRSRADGASKNSTSEATSNLVSTRMRPPENSRENIVGRGNR